MSESHAPAPERAATVMDDLVIYDSEARLGESFVVMGVRYTAIKTSDLRHLLALARRVAGLEAFIGRIAGADDYEVDELDAVGWVKAARALLRDAPPATGGGEGEQP